MISHEMSIGGTTLHAYFQPYHLNLSYGGRPPHTMSDSTLSGELLTRPQGFTGDVETFFSELTIHEHFEVLNWHLELAETLHREVNACTSINLHNSVLHEDEDRARLLDMLSASSSRLCLEFTETYPMPPRDIANKFLRDLRKLGHQTALDDFGTGLNGMSLLTDFDFDIIKIDRSLTFDLTERLEKRKMLALILKMLDVLGRDHVVEGVEDVSVYEFLLELRFVQFQGYLFEQPLRIDEFVELHRERKEML